MEVFSKELEYIKDIEIRKNAKILIDMLPDYFFKVAASSTGKYHPTFSLGEAGLYRHTKAVVRIAYELYQDDSICNIYTKKEKDLMLVAMILHDGLKHGFEKSEYVVFEHPILMSNFILEQKDKLTLKNEDVVFISDMIKTHMGPWTTDYRGNEILEKPKTKYQKFVHMCDFLASRKFLDIKFENDEIV